MNAPYYLHYMLGCECGAAIPLPHGTIEQAFHYLGARSKDADPIAAVCDRCKRVQNADLARKSNNPPWGPWVLSHDSGWAFVGLLECEKEACKSRLPLLAKWNQTISPEEWTEYVHTWKWDRLVCLNGHRIPKPE